MTNLQKAFARLPARETRAPGKRNPARRFIIMNEKQIADLEDSRLGCHPGSHAAWLGASRTGLTCLGRDNRDDCLPNS